MHRLVTVSLWIKLAVPRVWKKRVVPRLWIILVSNRSRKTSVVLGLCTMLLCYRSWIISVVHKSGITLLVLGI
jgi:hypothetical protein